MGSRQIVLVSTAGISVLNAGIFWRESKTKRLFSQCTSASLYTCLSKVCYVCVQYSLIVRTRLFFNFVQYCNLIYGWDLDKGWARAVSKDFYDNSLKKNRQYVAARRRVQWIFFQFTSHLWSSGVLFCILSMTWCLTALKQSPKYEALWAVDPYREGGPVICFPCCCYERPLSSSTPELCTFTERDHPPSGSSPEEWTDIWAIATLPPFGPIEG